LHQQSSGEIGIQQVKIIFCCRCSLRLLLLAFGFPKEKNHDATSAYGFSKRTSSSEQK
jgi:hypothetical protein